MVQDKLLNDDRENRHILVGVHFPLASGRLRQSPPRDTLLRGSIPSVGHIGRNSVVSVFPESRGREETDSGSSLLYAVTLTMLDLQRRDDRKYDRPTGYSAAASSDPETVQKE